MEYTLNISFSEALKWMYDVLGLNFYTYSVKKSSLLLYLEMLDGLNANLEQDNEILEPLNESVLSEFMPYANKMWYDENISLRTQHEFEIGYDLNTNTITIPYRDALGNLVGVKARKFTTEPVDMKYFYLYNFAKTKVVYGLYKNYADIKKAGHVLVVESEKSVLKMYSVGFKSVVAISGHTLSNTQTILLSRLDIKIILCYDNDVLIEHLQLEAKKFDAFTKVYAIYDTIGILEEKESPCDNMEKFKQLWKKIIKLGE